jgi:hypothetical protein
MEIYPFVYIIFTLSLCFASLIVGVRIGQKAGSGGMVSMPDPVELEAEEEADINPEWAGDR